MTAILATQKWPTNAELIADVAALGYLRADWRTLDPTYGLGTFWKVWRPDVLVASDLKPGVAPLILDFRNLPFVDRSFDAVVFDPPYKLNGRPGEADVRYGVDVPRRWQDRMELCRQGITECARLLGGGFLLVKCMDQVCSGKVRWQTFDFAAHAERCGLELVDRLDRLGHRAQPANRAQVHARRNSSTLLVFKR